ncbi:MAG: phosphatase PAP2 family protein [Acidimicrobiales bacterium]
MIARVSTAAALVRAVADADRRGLQLAMRAPSATAHRRLAADSCRRPFQTVGGRRAAEAALGGRAGRRAALRGVLSIAASSLVVNAGLKPLLPRHRPDVVARALPFVRRPVSSSFPSGHSASAAAFAAATVMELPIAAPIVVPLAGLLGLSRATTGVHYPSDIVVGAGVGLAGGSNDSDLASPRSRHLHADATIAGAGDETLR